MSKISNVMFLVVAVAALGAVGVTTTLMTTHVAQAAGQCHENTGTLACTGSEGGFVCNKHACHDTGKP